MIYYSILEDKDIPSQPNAFGFTISFSFVNIYIG